MSLQGGRHMLRLFQTFLSLKKKTRVHRRVLAKLWYLGYFTARYRV